MPLVAEGLMSRAQFEDIRKRLRAKKIPYHVVSVPTKIMEIPARDRYLCVGDGDLLRAQEVLSDEFNAFALEQRERWEKEWREKYKGSYWKWLLHRQSGKTKMGLMKWIYFFT